MEAWFESLLAVLALPKFGLSTVFVVALISATLLPLGSEPAVFGLIKLNPELFWPAILVATAGNTIGGAISWGMGFAAEKAYERVKHKESDARALRWLKRFGAKGCLLSWLPIVGDPLCAVAGWLKLPFWPCVGYMAIGKFARYLFMTLALMWGWAAVAADKVPTRVEQCIGNEAIELRPGEDSALLDDGDAAQMHAAIAQRYPLLERDGFAAQRLLLWRKPGIGWVYVALRAHAEKPGHVCAAASFNAAVFELTAPLLRKYFVVAPGRT